MNDKTDGRMHRDCMAKSDGHVSRFTQSIKSVHLVWKVYGDKV